MHCVRPWHFLKDLLILILGLTQFWKNRVLIFQIDILFVIVEGVKVCGMQCLPLRGHRNDNTAECFTNQGNFFAILEYASKSDPVIKEHIEKGKKSESMHQNLMKSSM